MKEKEEKDICAFCGGRGKIPYAFYMIQYGKITEINDILVCICPKCSKKPIKMETIIYEDDSFRLIKVFDAYGLVELRSESVAEGNMERKRGDGKWK